MDFRWELDLCDKDARRVISMLVNLENNEDGENWLDESRDWVKFDVSAAWQTDEGMPDTGTVRITYNTEAHCADTKRRSGLAKFCAVGRGKGRSIPRHLRKLRPGQTARLKVGTAVHEIHAANTMAEGAHHGGTAPDSADETDSDDGYDPFAKKKKAKAIDKASWTTIDMSDLVMNNLKLRQSMASAMEDGDVDKGELREIVSTLLRAGHGKATINQVMHAPLSFTRVVLIRRARSFLFCLLIGLRRGSKWRWSRS